MDPATMAALMALFQMGSGVLGGLTDQSGYQKVSNFSPEQKRVFGEYEKALGGDQYSNQAIGLLRQFLDPTSSVFRDFEAPYMTQFKEQLLPGIAERFAGAGANSGALSSSGFGQALGGAAAGLESNLAGLKAGLQRSSIQDILQQYQSKLGNYSNFLGQRPYHYRDQGPGALSNILSSFSSMDNPFGKIG